MSLSVMYVVLRVNRLLLEVQVCGLSEDEPKFQDRAMAALKREAGVPVQTEVVGGWGGSVLPGMSEGEKLILHKNETAREFVERSKKKPEEPKPMPTLAEQVRARIKADRAACREIAEKYYK